MKGAEVMTVTDTRAMAATAVTADLPRAAGRVDSGPGAAYVHLVFLLGDGWVTACPADFEGLDGAGEGRQVRQVLAPVDCGLCLVDARDLVDAVNRAVAECQQGETAARELLARFLDWAAAEYPDGGAVLAAYDGGTRLHPMRFDERARAVDLWLESRRRYPVVE